MIRRLLLLSSLFVATSAFATWNPSFSTNYVQMYVGDTRTIYLRAVWSGLAFYDFHPWVCASDSWNVAHVEGGLDRLGETGEVTITAVGPGMAWVRLVAPNGNFEGGLFVEIAVSPRPVTVSIAPPALKATVGRPFTLVAISETTPVTFNWFNGRRGDTSRRLQANGNELTVTPSAPGRYYFWVSAVASHGMSTDEIAVEVQSAPRRRAVMGR